MRNLRVKDIYIMANTVYKSKKFKNICDRMGIDTNDERLKHSVYALCQPEMCNSIFNERGLGDELHLAVKEGRIYYYIVNMWDMYTSALSPITNEILDTFEVNEENFELLNEFEVDTKFMKNKQSKNK